MVSFLGVLRQILIVQLTPTTTTSYLSVSSTASLTTGGVRRGNGGAKEGKMRRSRPELAVSVKTGIVEYDNLTKILRARRKKRSGINE